MCLYFEEQEEDPDHVFTGDAVLFAINETTNSPTSWLACSQNDCNFSKRQITENVYTHGKKVFYIYGKGRLTTNDPIRFGDEVALFYRVNDDGDGLWLGCTSGKKRCGLGTCPGLPHLNHWMWNSKHECNENKFVVTGSAGLQKGQPVRIEHQITLTRKEDSSWTASEKRYMDENSTAMLIEAPFLDNSGNWVIQKDMIGKCGNKHYDVRYKVCDTTCGSQPYVHPKYETWKCCVGEKPYNAETSLCCEGNVSVLYNTPRSATEARCCSNVAFFPERQVCCQGKVRDLPGQDTDADDTTVQCCGSEPYLSTHGICCNDVVTPFYPLKADSKDALQCCDDQGFNNRTSFCYSCGEKKHILPLTEKESWNCCQDKEIYKDDEYRCCEYGVEKGEQCKCLFQNNTYISGQRFSDGPATTSCRSCTCNDGDPVCQTVNSCPATVPLECTFYPDNGECCPVFQCLNSPIHNYKLFLRRKSHVSIKTAIPGMAAMTISFWMRTQQDSEGTALSYATQSQADELVIKTHPSVRVILKGSSHGSERDLDLNDGNWHFLWITWESSTGHLIIREGARTIGPLAYTKSSLEGGGYLVLGQRQLSQKKFIPAKAFVGEISHVNIWNAKRTDFEKMRKDCVGLYSGNIFDLSDNTIDTHQSASIIEADMCPNKAFHFPNKGVNNAVVISGMKSLTKITVCLWMNSRGSQGSLVSYAVPGQDNEVLFDYSTHFELDIGGESRQSTVTVHNGIWQHYCVTWESNSGSWKFYKNGNLKQEGTNFKKGYTIRRGGTLVLGQDQDSVGGGFDATQSFKGMLSNVNIWDRVLPSKTIKEMSTSCILDEFNAGNVYKWRDFLRKKGAALVAPSPCKPLGTDNAFSFPNKGTSDFVGLSGMSSLTKFTVCLWMNSTNSKGSLVSYAVSGQDNELLVYYDGHFTLDIGGEARDISVSAHNGLWHHICVTWERTSGSWKFYKDGELKKGGTNFKKGHTIRQGGTVVLGQDQDSVGGGFQTADSFQGMLSNVNIWNEVMTPGQIKKMSQSCRGDASTDDKVYEWLDFLHEGGATLVKPSPCDPVIIDNELYFQKKGTKDFVKISGMSRRLTDFTLCLWMSSSNTEGSLFSYAVSGQENELLLFYSKYFTKTTAIASDGEWHHTCVSWKSSSGTWNFYKDGVLHEQGTGFKTGYAIKQDGTVVLGQDQDSVGGGFETTDSFQGKLSNVNLWDHVLTANQITTMSKSCLSDAGNNGKIYKWIDFLREGQPSLMKPSSCKPFSLDYVFHFPVKGVTNAVKVRNMRKLTDFTICLWMSSSNTKGSLFSYAVSGESNELLIFYNKYFQLDIGGESRSTTATANDGEWHHICVSWEKKSGSWNFYKDCHLKSEGTNFKKGHTIRQGGTVVLGQDQDSVGGGFEVADSFQGMLSNVNVWDHVLPAAQIKEMSTSCLRDEWNEANVYKWPDFLRHGGTELVTPSPCEPFSIWDYAFNFPNKGVDDYVKLSNMPSGLTEFTVCLWMSSTSSQGSLFSYAVSGQDNELLIFYDKYFTLDIDGEGRGTSVTANDGAWHHICATWESRSGSWKFYKDGEVKKQGTNFKKGHTIRRGGTSVLGQDQDSVGGGFTEAESFQGMLSNVNFWSDALPSKTIKEMSTSCLLNELNDANVHKWSDFLSQGGTMLVKPSPCKPFTNVDYAFHFPKKGVDDVVKITGMSSLTAFTVCFWINFITSEGCPFSYAVSSQDNELQIFYYTSKFQLIISDATSQMSVKVNDGVWHHICASWESYSGSWKFYKDGVLKQKGTNFKKGYTIRGGGTLVLGQEQDSVGGNFDAKQSLQGMLSYVNVWDKAISATEINDMSRSCLPNEWNEGNVYKWTNFLGEGGALLVRPTPCVKEEVDKAFHFPDKEVDNVVKISGMRSLTDFTVCLWMSSTDGQGSLLSYAISGQDNELLLIYYGKHFELYIDNERGRTKIIANDGVWHHFCVSRERNSGTWKFYKDGYVKGGGTNFKKGHTIRQGGTLVLGQEQDSVGGGFEASQSFKGMLSNVNIWDHVVTSDRIQAMSSSCLLHEGNEGKVYKWIDFLREGGVRSLKPSPCEPLGTDHAFHFPDKGVSDAVKLSNMHSSLTQFTVCFWMMSKTSQGTPVSYAVSGQSNELIIEYYRNFQLTIGGTITSKTPVTAYDGEWHHICVSWESSSGSCKFYKDGDLKQRRTNFKRGYTIKQGGTWVLGQEQDAVGGGFETSQSFQGMLSNVNIWNKVLTDAKIKEMSGSCLLDEIDDGNVYKWLDFLSEGGAKLVKPTPCKPFKTLDYAFHFNKKGVDDYVYFKKSRMPSLTAFTVCMWISSTASDGTTFSYAVPSNYNELFIAVTYNRHFELVISGGNRQISVRAYDGVWHHICASWENSLGSWKFYKDGDLKQEGTNFQKGYTIKQGGVLVLGQDQDSLGGGFQTKDSFQGMLSNFNIWDRVLSAAEIKSSKSCLLDAGNAYTWSDILREGGPKLVQTSPCKTVGAGDWKFWNGHYYNYQGKSGANSWFSAEGVCRDHGETVHLTSIHSQQENDFINSLSSGEEEQWIGLTNHNSGAFKWIDRSAIGKFKHWAAGEPNQATVDEDCGAMKPDGTWIDVACRKQRLGGDTPFDRRAFTCKASGNRVSHGSSTSSRRKVKEFHQPAISVVDVYSGGKSTYVTFFTGLHIIAPNGKFTSTADKVKYGALLKFGGYVDMTSGHLEPLHSQRRRDVPNDMSGTENDQDNDLSGVADLDGVVDKIEIPHYSDMSTMGSTSSPGFSIEFWIRPRRMPVDSTPMALFHKSSRSTGYISLNLHLDGSLTFKARHDRETKFSCTTNIKDDTHKVKALNFNHIAITGKVGSSLTITVKGEIACQTNSWHGVVTLPASSEGTLVFGDNSHSPSRLKKFNGQISNIQLFNTERTKNQIANSIRNPDPKGAGSIGFWSLRQSDEINVVNYVISYSQAVSQLKVLEDYDPPLTGHPLEAIVRNQRIYIFRLTKEGHIVVKKVTLSSNKRTIVPVPGNQRIITSTKAEKGCIAATRDHSRDRFILIECFPEDQTPGALRFKWNIFNINKQGQLTASTKAGVRGSLLVNGIGSLDTRLSAKVVDNHLLLTAGTTSSASIFFLDVTMSSDGFPSTSVDKLTAQMVGPEIADNGATYYAYLYKESSASSKPFLRRLRPQNGHVSTSYTIDVENTNPSNLVANAISSDMPDNDWFWFLFKISTLNGGIAIQSGERINIQTPDSNPKNDKGWSFVKSNCDSLQADQHHEQLNFWIFKTKSCDPGKGGYSAVSGEIGPNDCILLWPKTEQFEPGYYRHILALPTQREIESTKVRFGSWFGPWRLMIPTQSSPVRPIPVPAGSPSNSPRNVYQGNKYSLLHFGKGISLITPSPRLGVRGGLLRFAKTTVTPTIVSNNGNPASIKLIFRGNGGSFPLASFPHDERAKLDVIFTTVYKEGSYAQRRMTSGLFYSIAYNPPSDSSSAGEFKNLARIGGLESLEYPNPPTSFVWLIPPPFKVTGMCAAISTIFQFNSDAVNNNSVASLTGVVTNAVGPGSFGEGLFKPFLSVHFDVTILNEIGERIHASFMRKISERFPKPPPARPTKRPASGKHSWQELGDLEACVSLSNSSFWANKVQNQKVKDRLTQVLQSKWMNNEIFKIRQEVAPDFLRNASAKYSAYGGIAVLIATRLRSPEFLEELLTNDQSYIQPILDSHLKILDFIRPDLGIAVREDIMSALLAKEIVAKPWTILQSLDREKQREAISAAITAIYEGPRPKEEKAKLEDVIDGVLNIFLYPLTSTQLGVLSNFIDMRKLDVLSAVDARALEFKENFLDIFVQEHSADITEINQAKQERREAVENFDSLLENPWEDNHEEWVKNWRKFEKLPKMRQKRYKLRDLFSYQLGKAGPSLTELPSSILHQIMRNNPRFVAGMSHTFNFIGAVGATISIFKEVLNPDSGFRQGNVTDVMSVVATAIGGVGSVRGTYELAKVVKEKLFKTRRPADTGFTDGYRTPEELATFEEELATEVSVDLNNMERQASRLARMAKTKTIGRVFTAFGVVADTILLGVSIYDLYVDFNSSTKDYWKIADDFALAASAGVGAGLGIAAFIGVTGAAAAATGIGAVFVLAVGLFALISEAIRERVKKDRERNTQCNKWKQWCSWSKGIFDHHGFLKDSDADPCSKCPTKKHHILRIIRLNPGLFPSALKRALINGLDSGKDVKGLVPSLGKIEKKTCPAWLRHVFKRQEKRR
ncbi:hypothetical protein ACROYT_G005997 [Oculina patagonica]